MKPATRDYDPHAPGCLRELTQHLPPCPHCKTEGSLRVFEIEASGVNNRAGKRVLVCVSCNRELPVCGVLKRKASTEFICCRPPMPNAHRCRGHGGTAKSGNAVLGYKGGYSKSIPERMLPKYVEAMSDPELIGARKEVGLLQMRVTEILEKFKKKGGSAKTWEALKETWALFQTAMLAGDKDEIVKQGHAVNRIIKNGSQEEALWEELDKAIESKTRIGQREQGRLVAMKQMASYDQIMTLVQALIRAVKINVTDKIVLGRINGEFTKILNVRHAPQALPGPGPVVTVNAIAEPVAAAETKGEAVTVVEPLAAGEAAASGAAPPSAAPAPLTDGLMPDLAAYEAPWANGGLFPDLDAAALEALADDVDNW